MILLLDGILGNGGEIKSQDFAERLKYWTNHGFPELGDMSGLGIGQTVMVKYHDIFDTLRV